MLAMSHLREVCGNGGSDKAVIDAGTEQYYEF